MPTQVAPANGASVVTPVLQWQAVPGHGRYRVTINRASGSTATTGTTYALSWTPDWDLRVRLTQKLFEGGMTVPEARHFVRATGARFVFTDCRPGLRDLEAELRPLIESVRRFECATLYALHRHPGTVLVGD